MRATALPRFYNAIEILEHNLPERSSQIALYSEGRQMTFQEVSDEVNQVGNALRRLDVRMGEYVGILLPDSPEWAATFFGIAKVGAIAICMNTLLQPHEYSHMLQDSRARVLVVDESLLHAIEPIRGQLPRLKYVIVVGRPQRPDDLSYRQWIRQEPVRLEVEQTHRDDFCSLHYSSGTTGEPKGIHHAHKDYPLIAELSGVQLFGLQPGDRTFSVAKLSFVYGLGANLVFPWYVGASTILYAGSARTIGGVLKMIEQFKATFLVGIPTAYTAMLALDNFTERFDLSSLRLCISAGEALPASIWQAWKAKTGLEILDTVGCTETFHTFLSNRPGAVRPGSSGKPSPGYEVKLIDDQGKEVPIGEVGNLMVKGESVAQFYLHQYERSRHTFRGEWLFTGDKFICDADGYYWHAGRSDDMLKVGGLWVSPVEVEGVLMTHPAVLECAVIGEHDQSDLVKPKAMIRLREGIQGSDALVRELLGHCAGRLAPYKCPRWIEFIGELPKTATGKIQRYKLRTTGAVPQPTAQTNGWLPGSHELPSNPTH